MNDIKISTLQFFVIVSLFLSGGSTLILPAVAAAEAKQNAWISVLLSMLIGIAVMLLYIHLNRKFPKQTFVQYSEVVLGKIFGKIVSAIFLFSTFILAAILLWDVSTLVNVQMMPETPLLSIDLLIIIVIVMGARYGLEVIARTGEILFPYAAFLVIVPILFLAPHVQWDNMLPMLEEGIKPILRSSYSVTAIMFIESYVLLMIMPYVSKQKGVQKAFLAGVLLTGMILFITVMYCTTVLGANATSKLTFPTYTLVKLISIGRLFERIEAIIAAIWIITIYYKATICLYVTALGISQLFKLRSHRPLIIPLAFILLPLGTIIFPNTVYFRLVSGKYYPLVDYMVGLFIPLIVWLVYEMRKKTIHLNEGGVK